MELNSITLNTNISFNILSINSEFRYILSLAYFCEFHIICWKTLHRIIKKHKEAFES